MLNVLRDIDTGTWSVLEHGYLTRVERPHGLPSRLRQVRQVSASGTRYRDVELPGLTVIELDAAMQALTTVRLGYGQVHDRPCRTATKVAAVLTRLGWSGRARPCGAGCGAMPVPQIPVIR